MLQTTLNDEAKAHLDSVRIQKHRTARLKRIDNARKVKLQF